MFLRLFRSDFWFASFICCSSLLLPLDEAVGDDQFFEEQVRPLLSQHCLSCHGEKKQESDLRLDVRASVLEGGASGDASVIVGDADASLLIQYVRREVEGMEMPPEKSLSEDEVAILERWVQEGLQWPEEATRTVVTMDDRFAQDRASHWAFQPVELVRPNSSQWSRELQVWPRNQLDEFVAEELHKSELTPSEEADDRTLIRRLNFDLLGLPPTMEETVEFAKSSKPDAYERLVDRLLASPAYGERWGRHWLDVARYADTRGYTFGGADRNYAWSYTYRDYVIDSFNADLPYDQFVVEQLAADKLELGEDNRALAAMGFLSTGRKFNNQHDDIDDLIDAVTRGFVGLTVACARCHDHKYDAIPTEDYYSLYGVFNSSRESAPPLIGDAETLASAKNYEQKFNAVNGQLSSLDSSLFEQVTNEAHTGISDYLVAVATRDESGLRPQLVREWKSLLRKRAKADSPTLMPWFRLASVDDDELADAARELAEELQGVAGEALNPFVREAFTSTPPKNRAELAETLGRVLGEAFAKWKEAGGNDNARRKQPSDVRQLLWYFFDPNSPAKIKRDRLERYLTDEEKEKRKSLQRDVAKIRETQPVAYHRAMVVTDKPTAMNARVFIRGNAARRGDKVPRQGPRLLTKSQTPYEQGSGRLELAKEIVHPDNPLTARVIVNRVWMHHFGRPLVSTPSDFGIRCDEPKQRALLDYLASVLVRNDWSIKSLHREILLSSTYRQASGDRPECYAVDPENDLLWRMNRRRLEFESMRDALLFVGGQLNRTMGGKPVRQFRNPTGGRRRSVYGYLDRQDLPNLLRVFDFASPDASAEKRADTTVPQQALFMLNSPFVVSQAKAVADKIVVDSNERFVDAVYEQTLARRPTKQEQQVALSLLESQRMSRAKLSRRERLAQLLLLTNEFCYVD